MKKQMKSTKSGEEIEWSYTYYDSFISSSKFIEFDTQFEPPSESAFIDAGIYTDPGSKTFPEGYFDLNGLTSGNWQDFYKQSGNNTRALCVFQHQEFDFVENDDRTIFQVEVECVEVNNVASDGVRNAETRSTTNEWYLDHIAGYIDENGNKQTTEVVQKPDREHNAISSNNNGYRFDVNYKFPAQRCMPNTAVAFMTRGYEKDDYAPDTPGYKPGFDDWMDLFKDFRKALKGRPGKFVLDCIAMLIKSCFEDYDDPMTPSATLLSHGACRWIHENCGGEIFIDRDSVEGYDVRGYMLGPPGLPLNYYYRYAQRNSTNPMNRFDLRYKVTVTPVGEVPAPPLEALEGEGESYLIQALHSGKCLGVENSAMGYDAIVRQYPQNSQPNQSFVLNQVDPGIYTLEASHSDMLIGIDSDTTWGENAKQAGGNYRFRITPISNIGYQILPETGSLCLGIEHGSTDDGHRLCTCTNDTAPHELFSFIPKSPPIPTPTTERHYRVISKSSSMRWQIENQSQDDGAQIIQGPPNGSNPSQSFMLEHADDGHFTLKSNQSEKYLGFSSAPNSAGIPLVQVGTPHHFKIVMKDGSYARILTNDGRWALELENGSLDSGTRIVTGEKEGNNSELFHFEETNSSIHNNQYYRIEASHSGKVWAVKDNSKDAGALIVQQTPTGSDAEVFKIEYDPYNPDDPFKMRFQSKSSGLYLELAGQDNSMMNPYGNPTPGTAIRQQPGNDTQNQRFHLLPFISQDYHIFWAWGYNLGVDDRSLQDGAVIELSDILFPKGCELFRLIRA